MRRLLRPPCLIVLLSFGGFFVFQSAVYALPEKQIRDLVLQAEAYEKQPQPQWERAREIYELLLKQPDLGLGIRQRYHRAVRHCWRTRRHGDPSYRKEVLSIEFGQAMRMYGVITNTLLDGSIAKKTLNPNTLFAKGLDELDASLGDPVFLQQHVPATKLASVPEFRALVKKTWGRMGRMSRKEAARQISEIAMAAEIHLGVNGTVVAMEMACGACYAIDQYTVYLTPNQLRELADNLARTEVVGVGLVLTIRENRIAVHSIIDGGSADRSDEPVFVNDQIVTINKKAVADLPIRAVRALLEGPSGSVVDLEVLTPGQNASRMISLVRQRPLTADLEWYPLMQPGNGLGYLKINQFTDTTPQDVDIGIAGLMRMGAKGIILDLRGNGGGLFDSSIDVAHRFLPTGIIASTINQDSKKSRIYQARNPNAWKFPIAVLVDGGTASAAEVLAGALKDNDRAMLIGQTTFGKGCIQRVLKLPRATGGVPTGGMKLTVERFFSPKGVAYSERGVVPHFIVDDTMEPASQANMMQWPTLRRAIEELNRAIAAQK
ncbi:MAG: S41 family peptidase [Planctomycetes bacterium]|nr:S41 family peptidase [Planctomycetota bacterium]